MSVYQHALMITSWQENLVGDEMPPRWMWHLDWELETHFALVKSKRDAKYNTGSNNAEPEPIESENVLFDQMEKLKKGY